MDEPTSTKTADGSYAESNGAPSHSEQVSLDADLVQSSSSATADSRSAGGARSAGLIPPERMVVPAKTVHCQPLVKYDIDSDNECAILATAAPQNVQPDRRKKQQPQQQSQQQPQQRQKEAEDAVVRVVNGGAGMKPQKKQSDGVSHHNGALSTLSHSLLDASDSEDSLDAEDLLDHLDLIKPRPLTQRRRYEPFRCVCPCLGRNEDAYGGHDLRAKCSIM